MKKLVLILTLTAFMGSQVHASIFDTIKKGRDAVNVILNMAKEMPGVINNGKNLAENVNKTFGTVKGIAAKKTLTPAEAKQLVGAVVDTGDSIEQILQSILKIVLTMAKDLVGKFDAEKGKQMTDAITKIQTAIANLKTIDGVVRNKVLPMMDKIPAGASVGAGGFQMGAPAPTPATN